MVNMTLSLKLPRPVAISYSCFIPYLSLLEIWFNIITQKAIRRGTFKSVKELISKIEQFVNHYNTHARPFIWSATADSILEKIKRLCILISET
jgi:putative transposase